MNIDWTQPAGTFTAEQLYQAFAERMGLMKQLTPEQRAALERHKDDAEDDIG